MIHQVSILLPTFNCEKYILSAIKSILWQTYKHFELIIIDDGSTDNTIKLVKTVNDERIKYVKIEHCGISNALNFGLKIAKYDWIARMDADDLSLPNRLERQINFISNNPSYNVISSWYATFSNKRLYHLFKLPVDHSSIVQGLELHSPLCHLGTIFNKQLILSVEGYSDCPFEDYDLWLRLKDKATFYNIPEPLVLVRLRKDSLYRKDLRDNKKEIICLQKKYLDKDTLNSISNIDYKKNQQLEGWREWFYGDKNKARHIWSKNIHILKPNLKVLLAFILTYLSNAYFDQIKSKNVKAILNKYLILNRNKRKQLKSVLHLIDQ